MAQTIITEPLTKTKFQDFGEVIDTDGEPDMLINQGLCERYHDKAKINVGPDGRVGLSLFNAKTRSLPLVLNLSLIHI